MLAHEGEEVVEILQPSLEEVVRQNSFTYSLYAVAALFILTILSAFFKDKSEFLKVFFFGGIVLTILANTIYLVG